VSAGPATRHLLAINFRDPGHPEAGGAELHLDHILREAVARGWRVTWLASGFPGGPTEEWRGGIHIVRRGSWWNFNLVVPGVLRREFSAPPPSFVVEDINKAPCFAPWWTPAPVAAIVPHLFGATAFQEAPPPIALYVLLLEQIIPIAFGHARFLAISESTRDDLVHRGISREKIAVVHCGLDHDLYRLDPSVSKTPEPTIVFVGRLRRYKGLDRVIRALPRVRASVPNVRLVVLGDGPFGDTLQRMATRLGLTETVEFRGFVPPALKVCALQESWVHVQPSPKEGWGLTVVEAGACGTAVVAADSPGLRDSVRDGVTGLLFPAHDDERLAAALTRVLSDTELRERLGRAGMEWAARFRWPDSQARSLDALLEGLPAPGAG
jgi:glycosyltransferase involved in cell wall biosynthesis